MVYHKNTTSKIIINLGGINRPQMLGLFFGIRHIDDDDDDDDKT